MPRVFIFLYVVWFSIIDQIVQANQTTYINPSLSDEYIEKLNKEAITWKAGRNFPANTTDEFLMNLFGVLPEPPTRDFSYRPKDKEEISLNQYPSVWKETFDAREVWKHCQTIGHIRHQGPCGSCWAFATTSVFSDRMCIATKGQFNKMLSAQQLIFCIQHGTEFYGCTRGSWPHEAFKFIKDHGIVTGGDYSSNEGCQPYKVSYGQKNKHKCEQNCYGDTSIDYKSDHVKAMDSYDVHSSDIQIEVLQYGPITATFKVYDDFYSYKSGVYIKQKNAKYRAAHAVKLIGWGVKKGIPYWLMVNSWGPRWGDGGTFKIRRGTNECNIEKQLVAARPDLTYYSKKRINPYDHTTKRIPSVEFPTIRVRGSYFQIGYEIGKTFSSLIRQNIDNDKMLQRSLRQYDTPNGKVEYEKIISSAEKLCPQQLKQIYGMSFGANITVHKLMLYQLYDELTGGYGKDTKISTSTVINESNKKALIFFDVDLEENFVNYYRVWAEVIPAEDEMGGTFKAVSSEWLAYVKAGTLPGQLLTERGNTTVTVNRKFGKTLAKIAPLLIPIQVVEIIEMAEKNKFIKIEKLLGELTESFLENSGIEWTRYNLDLSTLDFVAKRHFLKINIDINSRITEDAKYNVERIPVASNTPNTKYCGWRNDIFNAVTSYCFELYLNSTENRLRNDIQSMSVTGVPYSSSFVRLTCVKDYNEGTMGVFKVNPKIRPSGVLYLPNT